MLRKIILIFTDEYKDKIVDTHGFCLFLQEMKEHGAEVILYGKELWKKLLQEGGSKSEESDIEDTLFISDNGEILEKLQEDSCFIIACYHEKVEGILNATRYAIEGLEGIEWEYLDKVYQRYRNIPWQITHTQRCLIREMGTGDLDDLYELYADKRVTRYTEALFQDKEQEKHYIEDYIEHIYKYFGFGTWLIHRKEDGRLIGRAGFNFRPGFDEAELGFVVGYPFWRKGYAYEVCSHLLELGKNVFEFERIQALVDKENEASIRLLEKLGFYFEHNVVVDGCEYMRYLYE